MILFSQHGHWRIRLHCAMFPDSSHSLFLLREGAHLSIKSISFEAIVYQGSNLGAPYLATVGTSERAGTLDVASDVAVASNYTAPIQVISQEELRIATQLFPTRLF